MDVRRRLAASQSIRNSLLHPDCGPDTFSLAASTSRCAAASDAPIKCIAVGRVAAVVAVVVALEAVLLKRYMVEQCSTIVDLLVNHCYRGVLLAVAAWKFGSRSCKDFATCLCMTCTTTCMPTQCCGLRVVTGVDAIRRVCVCTSVLGCTLQRS